MTQRLRLSALSPVIQRAIQTARRGVRLRGAPVAWLLLLFTVACRNGQPRARFAPRVSAEQTVADGADVHIFTNACPSAPSANVAGQGRAAALLIVAKVNPAPKAGATALVRITGDNTPRTSVAIDPTQLARFELAPDAYDVQITLDGYPTYATRIRLTLGCTLQLTPQLTGRSVRR